MGVRSEFFYSEYIRVDKRQAFNRFKKGQDIYLLASKLNPNNIFQAPSRIVLDTLPDADSAEVQFDNYISNYRYYNCDEERGLVVRFYYKTETV